MTQTEKVPLANPLVVLREEFDDWAILFDPDTGNAFGVNPLGVLVWKRLDGRSTVDMIIEEIGEAAEGVPAEAADHIRNFIRTACDLGLAGYAGRKG